MTTIEQNSPRRPRVRRAPVAVPRDARPDAPGPVLRIAPGSSGVSIWSETLFADATPAQLREFLGRVFSVDDVASVEIRRHEAFGRITYAALGRPADVWRRLSRAITSRSPAGTSPGTSAADLFLEGPAGLPIEVTRIGAALSSWRVRHRRAGRVRLTHPILRKRTDVALRLEEELISVLGVRACRTSTVSGSVAIRFDPALVTPERLVRQMEQFWPRLLGGLDGPPSAKRLIAATGLLGLAATGQFFVAALRPAAVLGVVIYGSPNVGTAIRQLLRWQVGLPALYSFGLALLLVSGMPFNATVFAVLMQSWPRLAYRTMSQSQRRLFAVHRQRATWARLRVGESGDLDVDIASLESGDVISIRPGEVVPVDGTVVGGLAAVDEETLSGIAGAVDKSLGDPVYATSYVRDGTLLVRVGEPGARPLAADVARLLPHASIADLPSSMEAERIANRNAKPALALAAASLFVQRLVRPSQAIIRPDYITAHRLGAQLAALHDIGDALHQGIVFRRHGALDLLAATDIYVIDESAALERRRFDIAEVFATEEASVPEVVGYAAAAFPPMQNERARALRDRCAWEGLDIPGIYRRRRVAGAVAYIDEAGQAIEIAGVALATGDCPAGLKAAIERSAHAAAFDPARLAQEHLLRPLFVKRGGCVIGAIAFKRAGALEGADTIANLRAMNPAARFVLVSSRPKREAEAAARELGIDTAVGGLDSNGKARLIRELGPRTLWVGDGASFGAGPPIGAASVSVSVAGFATVAHDQADIVLLEPSLRGLVPLRRIARAHRARLEADYKAIYGVNLFGVAGGVFANFGGLQSGLISNAGTGFVYLRHRSRLRDLAARFEARRRLLATPGREEAPERIGGRARGSEKYVSYRELTASDQPMDEAEGV